MSSPNSRPRVGLLAAALLLALSAPTAGCLRGSQSDTCEVLKDCLCGDLNGPERAECIAGANRAGLAIDIAGDSLPLESCEVALHQQGDACPAGDLTIRERDPNPARVCVHDGDCGQVDCECSGSSAVSVPVRQCVDGVCIDPDAECARRCLMGRVVRGDPCRMLQRCRCAPLFDDADRDVDRDGVRDLDACLEAFDFRDEGPEACLNAARRESTDSTNPLPSADCPDVDLFVDDSGQAGGTGG